MARRAMNALQLALGSVGSGIQGYTQARTAREAQELEASRYATEQERLRKAEARQMAMDLANLQAQGYEPVGNVQRKQQEAADAARSLAVAAMNSTRGAGMSLPSAASQQSLMQGYATAKPERTLEYGGQQLALRETAAERQERLAREAEMRQRKAAEDVANAAVQAKKNRIESLVGSGLTRAQATQAVELDAKYGDVAETPGVRATMRGQDITAATARARLAFEREQALRAAGGKAQTEGRGVLPSVTEAMQTLRSITPDNLRKISSYGVAAASQGQQAGGVNELMATGIGGLIGVVRDEEKRYAQQVGSIADAVARASEVGVLTNFDINRFRSQVVFSPGDSEQLKSEKLARAVKWAAWLESNKSAIDAGRMDKVTGTPESTMRYQIEPRKAGESPEAYLARTGGR
jgi:hypothetical protein